MVGKPTIGGTIYIYLGKPGDDKWCKARCSSSLEPPTKDNYDTVICETEGNGGRVCVRRSWAQAAETLRE